ncbi:ribosomal protein S5 domain 2-type protein [Pelomyxa schiedti]|nr:ribosomal protein S5 domain 2-type protein [Pelomyxa schiedti]
MLFDDALSNNERDLILSGLRGGKNAVGRRIDSRGLLEPRRASIALLARDSDGSTASEVILGFTRVVAVVKGQIVEPRPERPNEGFLVFTFNFSPMASPAYALSAKMTASSSATGNTNAIEVELRRVIEKSLRNSRAIDMESLCVLAGHKVWSIHVTVHILDHNGNAIDCASIAVLSALLHYRKNDVTVTGEDVVVHSFAERDPVPLIIHHLPVSTTFAFFDNGKIWVVDPLNKEERVAEGQMTICANKFGEICFVQKNGGVPIDVKTIFRCTEFALQRAIEITDLINRTIEGNHPLEPQDVNMSSSAPTGTQAAPPPKPPTSSPTDATKATHETPATSALKSDTTNQQASTPTPTATKPGKAPPPSTNTTAASDSVFEGGKSSWGNSEPGMEVDQAILSEFSQAAARFSAKKS